MKRSAALKSYARLRPGKPMRRTWMKRKPARRLSRERAYKPYVEWLHGAGAVCIVCGSPRNIQGSHVGIGGMALRDGSPADMVRMCGPRYRRLGCHDQWGGRNGRFAGWSDADRDESSRGWRLLHWEAFTAWVGVEVARRDVDPAHAARLVACEELIAAARARLTLGTSVAA
jgi:hypothetical protein